MSEMTKTEQAKRIVEQEVFTLANELVEQNLMQTDDGFYDNMENATVENEDGDCEYKEVYQWFIVSDWLAEHLTKVGAVVVGSYGLNLWGRTEYGQALEYDYDINAVAAAIVGGE